MARCMYVHFIIPYILTVVIGQCPYDIYLPHLAAAFSPQAEDTKGQ